MMTSTEILKKVRMIKDYKQTIKQFQEELEQVENELKGMMEEKGTEEYCVDVFTIRYTEVASERFDSTAFKKTHEELYKQYLKQTVSKRFSIT